MAAETTNRRSYGTGSLFEKADKAGRVSWYGQWWSSNGSKNVQVKRKIGLKRPEDGTDGLTKKQAEKKLTKLMAEVKPAPRAPVHALTITEVGERYLTHLEKMKGASSRHALRWSRRCAFTCSRTSASAGSPP